LEFCLWEGLDQSPPTPHYHPLFSFKRDFALAIRTRCSQVRIGLSQIFPDNINPQRDKHKRHDRAPIVLQQICDRPLPN
jgi:hypothetical protein